MKDLRMMPLPGLIVLLLGLLPCTLPAAEIYKQVLPDGTTSYSGVPSPNAEKIEPPPPQVVPPMQPLDDSAAGQERPASTPAAAYSQLSVVEPANDQVIWSNEREVSVTVAIEPALKVAQGHRLMLVLDGTPATPASGDTHFSLSDIDRGSHTLVAEVHDALGRVLLQSSPVTFHLKQHSSLQPARPPTR
jgi:hypothetical protein